MITLSHLRINLTSLSVFELSQEIIQFTYSSCRDNICIQTIAFQQEIYVC